MRTDRPARPGRGASRRGDRPDRRRGEQRRPAPPAGGDLLYGRNAVAEALIGPRSARRLLMGEGVREDERVRALLASAAERRLPVERVPKLMLDDLTHGGNHQGVVLEAAAYPYAALDDALAAPGTLLLLDHLQDPQNLGTLLRAAEASGVAGVVIPQDRAVAVTPAVVNASAGAVEHLRVARVPNLARVADQAKERGRWVVGLDTGPDARDLFATDLPSPLALVVGAEGGGIGPNLRRRCDVLVSLPMRGRVASLNAASAGAIALFELLRREIGASESGS